MFRRDKGSTDSKQGNNDSSIDAPPIKPFAAKGTHTPTKVPYLQAGSSGLPSPVRHINVSSIPNRHNHLDHPHQSESDTKRLLVGRSIKLSGEISALSTGFSEAVDLANAGEVKIIGVTSDARVDAAPNAMTMKEQGIDTSFVNWRGFFGAPGLPADKTAQYQEAISKMYATPEWETVRARNGWVNIHNSGDDFKVFLEAQEQVIGDLMRKLGFL